MTRFRRKWEIDSSCIEAEIRAFDESTIACFERTLQFIEWDPEDGKVLRKNEFETLYLWAQRFYTKSMVILYIHDTTKIRILGVKTTEM